MNRSTIQLLHETDDDDDWGYEMDDELELAALSGVQDAAPRCRGCGCTEGQACEGGCIWATEDLCSACVRRGVT
jgi:hypothetical protein